LGLVFVDKSMDSGRDGEVQESGWLC
jgi:hypothetical protein